MIKWVHELTEEEKKLKVTIDFGSSFKFWLAYLLVQIIAMLIAVAVIAAIIGLLIGPLTRTFPPAGFIIIAQRILGLT